MVPSFLFLATWNFLNYPYISKVSLPCINHHYIMCFCLFTGPFMLTNLLLEDLKKVGGEEGGDARIITVASSAHDPETMRRKSMYFLISVYTQS